MCKIVLVFLQIDFTNWFLGYFLVYCYTKQTVCLRVVNSIYLKQKKRHNVVNFDDE